MIETTPEVHLSVYDYPVIITKDMIETASEEIWKIVKDAKIQHSIRYNMMYLFHHTSITEAWNAGKIKSIIGGKKAKEMDQYLFGTYTTL